MNTHVVLNKCLITLLVACNRCKRVQRLYLHKNHCIAIFLFYFIYASCMYDKSCLGTVPDFLFRFVTRLISH